MYELQSIFTTELSEHGFLIDYMRDTAKLQKGPPMSTIKGSLISQILTVPPVTVLKYVPLFPSENHYVMLKVSVTYSTETQKRAFTDRAVPKDHQR